MRADKFLATESRRVSKRLVWLGEAAAPRAALPPTHRRIMAQTFGVVHVFISRETIGNGLPPHSDKSMPAVLAGSRNRITRRGQGRPGPRDAIRLTEASSIFIFEMPMRSERMHRSGLPEMVLSTSTSAATCS